MIVHLTTAALLVCGALFSLKRIVRYLHILQQDEYAADRFLIWYKARLAFDKRGMAVAVTCFAACLFITSPGYQLIVSLVGCAALIGIAYREPNPLREGKILLRFTPRARRIFLLALGLYAALSIMTAIIGSALSAPIRVEGLWLLQLVLIQLVPFLLLASVRILAPFEERQKSRYVQEARHIFKKHAPRVIGITGSYGKTSVKELLGTLLQTSAGPTFWPRGGINTLMGNTQAIREHYSPSHRFAIIEMAAYRHGSIATLCELTRPSFGILTAIGEMHLERFGSTEAIYQAKSELVQAIPSDGTILGNGDDPRVRRAFEEHAKGRRVLFGFGDDLSSTDCRMRDVRVQDFRSHFMIDFEGRTYEGSTALLGTPALRNILAAFCAARLLGANAELALGVIANLTPTKNRLSLERVGEVWRLNDAYNSNPQGFAAALEVLHALPAKRRYLITPGMIELGDSQEERNRDAARKAAQVCDGVIVVAETNRKALVQGLLDGGLEKSNIYTVATREEGFSKLFSLERPGDASLIENDLGDWYEDTHGY